MCYAVFSRSRVTVYRTIPSSCLMSLCRRVVWFRRFDWRAITISVLGRLTRLFVRSLSWQIFLACPSWQSASSTSPTSCHSLWRVHDIMSDPRALEKYIPAVSGRSVMEITNFCRKARFCFLWPLVLKNAACCISFRGLLWARKLSYLVQYWHNNTTHTQQIAAPSGKHNRLHRGWDIHGFVTQVYKHIWFSVLILSTAFEAYVPFGRPNCDEHFHVMSVFFFRIALPWGQFSLWMCDSHKRVHAISIFGEFQPIFGEFRLMHKKAHLFMKRSRAAVLFERRCDSGWDSCGGVPLVKGYLWERWWGLKRSVTFLCCQLFLSFCEYWIHLF